MNPRAVSQWKLLRKKKIAATEQTIVHWETAVQFTVQKIWMPCSMLVAKVTEYVQSLIDVLDSKDIVFSLSSNASSNFAIGHKGDYNNSNLVIFKGTELVFC